MRGLLRFILLKTIWVLVVLPTVLGVSILIAFSIVRGIGALLGEDVDHFGACVFFPVAFSLLLLALLSLARAVRRFDERKAARTKLKV